MLVDYTRGKKIKELKSAVESAHSQELAKQAIFQLETGKERLLQRRITNHSVVAPIDGTLVYAKVPAADNPFVAKTKIAVGTIVTPQQPLFEIIPVSPAKTDRR